MLTDDEARRLLQLAGETVPVDPTRTLPEPPRRPLWPVLVAAAAVVAIAVTSLVLANRDGSSPRPEPAPPVPASVQVPSVLGYAQNDAVRTLMEAGFTVSSKPVPSCDQRPTAWGTEPAAGTPLEPGSAIVLEVTTLTDGYCVDDSVTLARELLNFADGRGPAPELADTVHVYEGSQDPVTITGAQTADPETWRACSADEICVSLLSRLSEAAHGFYPMRANGRTVYQSPYLSTAPGGPCSFSLVPSGLGRPALRLGVATPADGQFCTQDFVLDVYRSGSGEITAVALRTKVQIEPGEPASTQTDDLAHQFAAFARDDGDLPPIGDEVDLYLGNAFTGFVTPDSATDRRAWETCTELGSYAGYVCPFSPLQVLKRHPEVDYVDAPRGLCMPTYGPLPPDLRKADRVTIVPTEGSIDMCAQNFAVQLFSDDDGELIAVSLLLGEP
jgi:hypothetical protein